MSPGQIGKLRILPLGGLGEIGMNCLVLEYEDEILVIDCGLLFSDLEHFGVEFVIPDFTYLVERKEKVKAFVITHGHEDHIGSIPFALRAGIRAPVFASPFASKLIEKRAVEYGQEEALELRTFEIGESFRFKHFEVKTVPVVHSIVDAAALIIKTPVGQIVHTGDFKMDPTPYYGKGFDEAPFAQAGKEGTLLLFSDSTNAERAEHTLSEDCIYHTFETLFTNAEGLTVVALFASNVGRMGQVFNLAHRLHKKVVLSGRTMETNVALAMGCGYLNEAASVLIPMEALPNYPRKEVIVLSTGSQAEPGSALVRVSLGEHRDIVLQKKDLVILSSRYIPGNEKAIGRMINQLFKQGAEVLYESVHDIHVSGHAACPELKKMLELVKPRFFVPVHGEYRHLVHHAALARETGVRPENVFVIENGEILELSASDCARVGQIEEPRVLVERMEGPPISRLVLKERRQMAERGVVVAWVVRNAKNKRITAGPELLCRGLAIEDGETEILEAAQTHVLEVMAAYQHELRKGVPDLDLPETIRIRLRRFFYKNIGKKPVVLPIVLDL